MPSIDAVVSCPLHDSFRVQQVAGMFDVPLVDKLQQRFEVDVPDINENWQIGVIVGPSGSGKSTIARHAYADYIVQDEQWPNDCAVIDCFGDRSLRDITNYLTAVGFSSPPSWIKPYQVLSGGEQFRCQLARALLNRDQLIVFDEFTSVVDRTVAQMGSAAVAKAIRKGNIDKRFVAVTCHYDVVDWLEPDWVVDMATCQLARGRLRRPEIQLEIVRCQRDVWKMFAKHHYLSNQLSVAAECYLALYEGQPVAFCAVIGVYGHKGRKRITRVVTLPDYQGVGIGMKLAEVVGEIVRENGFRLNITASHPAVIGHCKRSKSWKTITVRKNGNPQSKITRSIGAVTSQGRAVVSFEFRQQHRAKIK